MVGAVQSAAKVPEGGHRHKRQKVADERLHPCCPKMMGVVQGAGIEWERVRCATELSKRADSLAGFVLGGALLPHLAVPVTPSVGAH